MGCAAWRRGRRGGKLKQKVQPQLPIPVVVGRRSNYTPVVPNRHKAKPILIPVRMHTKSVPKVEANVPSLYVLNAAALIEKA